MSDEAVKSRGFFCLRTHGEAASKRKTYTVARPEIGTKLAKDEDTVGRTSVGNGFAKAELHGWVHKYWEGSNYCCMGYFNKTLRIVIVRKFRIKMLL